VAVRQTVAHLERRYLFAPVKLLGLRRFHSESLSLRVPTDATRSFESLTRPAELRSAGREPSRRAKPSRSLSVVRSSDNARQKVSDLLAGVSTVSPRPYWKGYLKLSLVSCPIAVHAGCSSSERVSFRQISRKTGNRLRQQLIDEETHEPVEAYDKATRKNARETCGNPPSCIRM
jgi:hypothetical protein